MLQALIIPDLPGGLPQGLVTAPTSPSLFQPVPGCCSGCPWTSLKSKLPPSCIHCQAGMMSAHLSSPLELSLDRFGSWLEGRGRPLARWQTSAPDPG